MRHGRSARHIVAAAGTLIAVALLLALATTGSAQQPGEPCSSARGEGHWVDTGYGLFCQPDQPNDCAAEMQPGEELTLRREMVLAFNADGRRCFISEQTVITIAGRHYTLPQEQKTASGASSIRQALPASIYDRAEQALRRGDKVTFVATFSSRSSRTPLTARRYQFRLTPLPPPVFGKRVNVEVVRGTVRIRSPRGSFKVLRLGQQIPVGWFVDTRSGTVRLTSASNSRGATQTALFYDGIFQVNQKRATGAFTELKLAGPLAGCATAGTADERATTSRRRRGRRLWGSGTGRFRSIGTRASAGVRGTKWLIADRCDRSTLVLVKRGTVTVRDFVKNRTVVLKAGQRYVARRP